MHRLALIGCGKMGQAILRGLVLSGVVTGKEIVVCDIDRKPLADLLVETGSDFTSDPGDAVGMAGTVLLAVKPKDIDHVLNDIPPGAVRDKLLISIAAGTTLRQLSSVLPPGTRIVRAMPNTPALVRKGVTAYTAEPDVTEADHEFVCALFSALGSVHQVTEAELDVVTGLSGSGPAYLMTVIEAMADGAVRCGLGRDLALEMAARTVAGAGELVIQTGQHPAALRDAVASPGGTTMAGLAALEARGLRSALIEAVTAATLRGREMATPRRVPERDDRVAERKQIPHSPLAGGQIMSKTSRIMETIPAASIHGHEVIHMIAGTGRAFSRPELVAAIGARFGPEARFHTCSAKDLTADGLVGFLIERGKFFGDERSLALDPSQVCQH